MHVYGKKKLDEFKKKHSDAAPRVEAWLAEVEAAVWRTSQEIKGRYQQASFLANNFVVFNIQGNRYRLLVQIAYEAQTVIVKQIGTHKEYELW